MTDELYDYIEIELKKMDVDIVDSNLGFYVGPLISSLALEFYLGRKLVRPNKTSFHIVYRQADKGNYVKNFLEIDNVSHGNHTYRKVNKREIDFMQSSLESNCQSYINSRKLFLEDFYCVAEQIGVSFQYKQVIKTDEYENFIQNKFLSFGNVFHLDKILNLFSWANYLSINNIDFKFDKKHCLSTVYFIMNEGIIKNAPKKLLVLDDFYIKYLDKKIFSPYFFLNERDISTATYIHFFQNKGIFDSKFAELLDNLSIINKYFINVKDLYEFKNVWDILNKLIIKIVKNKRKTSSYNIMKAISLGIYDIETIITKDFFNKNISNEKFDKACEIINNLESSNHHDCVIKLKKLSKEKDLYYMVDFILCLGKNIHESFYGFLSNFDFNDLFLKEDTPNLLFKHIYHQYFKYLEASQEIYVDAIDLSDFKWKESVVELISNIDLNLEGEDLNHCVGGYGSALKGKRSRIFSVRYKKKRRSTLEIVVGEKGLAKIKQHYGFSNSNPHLYHRFIAQKLVEKINNIGVANIFSLEQTSLKGLSQLFQGNNQENNRRNLYIGEDGYIGREIPAQNRDLLDRARRIARENRGQVRDVIPEDVELTADGRGIAEILRRMRNDN
jgi:hypothetical protein